MTFSSISKPEARCRLKAPTKIVRAAYRYSQHHLSELWWPSIRRPVSPGECDPAAHRPCRHVPESPQCLHPGQTFNQVPPHARSQPLVGVVIRGRGMQIRSRSSGVALHRNGLRRRRPAIRPFMALVMTVSLVIAGCGNPMAKTPSVPTGADAATAGQWSAVLPWADKAVNAHVLPTGKVMYWPSWFGDASRLW